MGTRHSFRLWLQALALAVVPQVAFAATPRIVGTPVVENPSFGGIANTMMYAVTVTVDGTASDADHVATVGFVPEAEYTTCAGTTTWKYGRTQTFDTSDTRTWTLYNFQPGTAYYYKIRIGRPGTSMPVRIRCGTLTTTAAPTPTLPANLAALNLTYEKSGTYASKYVMIQTDDCSGSGTSTMNARNYLIAMDPANETIVWYLDIAALANLRGGAASGWRYQAGPTATSGRNLVQVDHGTLYEWGFDGSVVHQYDFLSGDECDGDTGSAGPCIHHDAFKSDVSGNTYVLSSEISTDTIGTPWETLCSASGSHFVNDGYKVLTSDYALESEHTLMEDFGYDPTIDGGPKESVSTSRPGSCDALTWAAFFDPATPPIDWTHVNSITVSRFGGTEVIDYSLRDWDQVIRIDASTGAEVWRLSSYADYTDWGPISNGPGVSGAETFVTQHDAHGVAPNTIMMLDNLGDPTGSRVLEVSLHRRPLETIIDKSWMMVDGAGDPLTCRTEGSANEVPGSDGANVMSVCADDFILVELDDATGATGTPAPLAISLPMTGYCSSGGPDARTILRGWHRAFPLATIGEF